MEELERLLELTQQKDVLDNERIEKVSALKLQIVNIQAEIDSLEEPFKNNIKILKDAIGEIKQGLIDNWNPEWEKQHKDEDTGITITRKTRQTPEIYDLKALMAQVVTFDKMPVKEVKWVNKDLKALISAGIVKPEVATLKEKYELAVTFPKDL